MRRRICRDSVQHRRKAIWDQVGRLHAYHGDVPAEVRLLKLTEEVGQLYGYHEDVPAEVRLLKLTEEVGEVGFTCLSATR